MRLIDADLFMQRIESYNTLDEKDKALYNFALNEIVCMPTVDVLEQIRAEIEETIESYVCDKEENTIKAQGMLNAMQMTFEIIDKHISRKENQCRLTRIRY